MRVMEALRDFVFVSKFWLFWSNVSFAWTCFSFSISYFQKKNLILFVF